MSESRFVECSSFWFLPNQRVCIVQAFPDMGPGLNSQGSPTMWGGEAMQARFHHSSGSQQPTCLIGIIGPHSAGAIRIRTRALIALVHTHPLIGFTAANISHWVHLHFDHHLEDNNLQERTRTHTRIRKKTKHPNAKSVVGPRVGGYGLCQVVHRKRLGRKAGWGAVVGGNRPTSLACVKPEGTAPDLQDKAPVPKHVNVAGWGTTGRKPGLQACNSDN